jgi:GNAT superfamily N-acetyltransferase
MGHASAVVMTSDPGDAAPTPPDDAALIATVVAPADHQAVIPLLLLAEPSASALRWSLRNLSDTAYRFDVDGALVGAATMRWRDDPSELVELAVAPDRQGQGIGRRIVAWLLAEARRRGRRAVEVGTSSTSLGNIAFYQKCGFRVTAVRPDYFWYHPEPLVEHGIPVRDMLVFTHELRPAARPRGRASRSTR